VKTILFLALGLGTLALEAQYQGRRGIRYINPGNTFTVRRTGDWSPNRRDGRCRIRVRIDDDSDVELRGDQIRIRVLRGAPGRDEGSECNAPLPTSGTIHNFRFRGISGRGSQRLMETPTDRNFYTAVVNVQDPRAGDEVYQFDLSWQWDGVGGGFVPPGGGPPPGRGGGNFPGGGLPDLNTSMPGFGTLDDGRSRQNLTDLSLRVRGSQCLITLINDRRQNFDLRGSTSPNTNRCIINSSNRGRTSANALILMDRSRVTGVDVSGNVSGRNFTANFRSR
jgi:hypothetical protein